MTTILCTFDLSKPYAFQSIVGNLKRDVVNELSSSQPIDTRDYSTDQSFLIAFEHSKSISHFVSHRCHDDHRSFSFDMFYVVYRSLSIDYLNLSVGLHERHVRIRSCRLLCTNTWQTSEVSSTFQQTSIINVIDSKHKLTHLLAPCPPFMASPAAPITFVCRYLTWRTTRQCFRILFTVHPHVFESVEYRRDISSRGYWHVDCRTNRISLRVIKYDMNGERRA
jgi:hypothetical protein